MTTIDINITGESYSHKSLPLSAQVTRNFWPQLQSNPSTRSAYILESFVGQKLFGTESGKGRGMLVHQGILYRVVNVSFVTVDESGVHTGIAGTIPGTGRCILVGIGSDVVIVTEGRAFLFDGSTVSEITDTDLETPNSAAHLNNQMIYDGDEGRFGVSDVGDASSINGLNFATAESNADDLIRVYTFDQLLYLFGEKTVEIQWNSGIGNPPFDRVEGGILQVGLGALHSVSNNDKVLYFLGDDHKVYAMTGSVAQAVSNLALSREISNYNIIDDAIGWCMTILGQNFYVLKFIDADRTWVYPERGQWFEWSSGVTGGRNFANSYAFFARKHLVEDERNGDIMELDAEDTYTENGAVIVRQRDSGYLHGGLVGSPGKTIEMNRFELLLETGTGILTGQGSDPVIMLSFSDDGGHTFSTEMFGLTGKLGEFLFKVEWFALGSFTTRILRIRTSDPVYFSIHSAVADIEVGI